MKKSIVLISLISALCFTACGKDASSTQSAKSTTTAAATSAVTENVTESAATTTAVTTTAAVTTKAETTKAANENAVPSTDYTAADLTGEWAQVDSFNNILTVNADGSFSLKYAGGGTRFGTVKIESEEHPDGSFTYWYSFYENDGKLWTGFVCPKKPFNEIYSEDEGGMKFVRNDSEKPLAPTVPEAKDIRDALAFADSLMSSGAVEVDMDSEYKTDDGTVYHKSVDNIYKTTADVHNYLSRYMTDQFISDNYNFLFGSENPKCIDVNGVLYIEYRPIGGIYGFYLDEDPVIVESGSGYSINIKNNDYGADETIIIDVVKDNGYWKINNVRASV
ncbi:MAG: hypothetical protein IKO47_11820 [Ruminococcus sp.]|nr:hypothetical protein [Ruminococcus sp.]